MSVSFESVWASICANEGQIFYTKTGLDFSYRIKDNTFYPSRTKYAIGKGDFEKAYRMVPIKGPGVINEIVRGPAYIWAVLHDSRISKGEW